MLVIIVFFALISYALIGRLKVKEALKKCFVIGTKRFKDIGLMYVLIKSYVFHDTHIRPSTTAKLFRLRLSTFIQASFDVYSQGVVWLSYSYLLLMASGVMLYFGIVYSWVFYVSLILTVISTYLLLLDVEKELNPKEETVLDKVEEVVLTWGELDE